MDKIGDQRLEHLGVPRDGGGAHRRQGDPVVAELAGDHLHLLRLPLGLPVEASGLEGALVGFRPAAGEIGGGEVRVGELGQPMRQLNRRHIGGSDVIGRIGQGRHLLGCGLGQLFAAVAHVHVPEAGQAVEVLSTLGVRQDAPLALDPNVGGGVVRRVLEGMEEMIAIFGNECSHIPVSHESNPPVRCFGFEVGSDSRSVGSDRVV